MLLGVIHIPSDVPGLLRAQSLVTSGLVFRSVSREPYNLISSRHSFEKKTWRCSLGSSLLANLTKTLQIQVRF
ncbi:MAG: hypothetical protein LBF66_01915 [Holosporales bacterium]|nr:hypothetical protein [Holosporales bacterium]